MLKVFPSGFLFIVPLLMAGCGTESGSSSDTAKACNSSIVVGSWTRALSATISDTMTFNADCSGTSSYCQSTFDYPNVTNSSGSVLITNKTTNAATGCLPAGETTCQYAVSGVQLTVSCGGGASTYTKN